ncbi:helix-turn-helix transcriptional regulator [Anaerocolumna sp. AGMB13020]|uniref:helix-turn-helix domain-containing protein n=1 Tax=Anaerocolumna sp. AGMB13020 TaxID=3081750 RepID=UPI002953245A|nr:helix-turn-helix transcriptional regulator [Anaerocolumna sp. AGMB13020]WOO35823.1 helix-turn-helix transcriptional regulator [Anaerocolumna sp. AGMB13020]
MLSNRLKELRKEKNLTQSELAEIIHLTRSSIAGYENGSKIPTIETVIELSKFFCVSTDYLLGVNNLRNHELKNANTIKHFLKLFENNYNKLDDSMKYIVSDVNTILLDSLYSLQQSNNVTFSKGLEKNNKSESQVINKDSDVDIEIQKELESYRKQLMSAKKAKPNVTKKVN